jgi:hypothetical protein
MDTVVSEGLADFNTFFFDLRNRLRCLKRLNRLIRLRFNGWDFNYS